MNSYINTFYLTFHNKVIKFSNWKKSVGHRNYLKIKTHRNVARGFTKNPVQMIHMIQTKSKQDGGINSSTRKYKI